MAHGDAVEAGRDEGHSNLVALGLADLEDQPAAGTKPVPGVLRKPRVHVRSTHQGLVGLEPDLGRQVPELVLSEIRRVADDQVDPSAMGGVQGGEQVAQADVDPSTQPAGVLAGQAHGRR